jgi:hypothetical protein
VRCLDVTSLQYTLHNALQEWRCTGNWNQVFFLKSTSTK